MGGPAHAVESSGSKFGSGSPARQFEVIAHPLPGFGGVRETAGRRFRCTVPSVYA